MSETSDLSIASDVLVVDLVPHGAEMTSLRHVDGTEYLWGAGPEWRRHAPVLFPVIGRVPDDRIHHDGTDYPLSQHGFARDRDFDVVSIDESSAVFRLESDDRTRERFPFDFSLTIAYAVEGSTLTIRQTVVNTGESEMAASVGNHPAFAFPLPGADGVPHVVAFSDPETEGFRRAPENLVLPDRHVGVLDESGAFVVDDAPFVDGVMIFDTPRRRTVTYSAEGARSIIVDTGDFPVIGVWKPVPGPFLCLEPWSTTPTPEGWDGDILDKPGSARLAPGARAEWTYSISLG